ncbi:hypothetical protein [Amycolatopsis kentuckyensis]|uniref:hypothetical protein n=1 Tax=Amycolatopsis kentuckyensis TaxID=218823 RepID=UPI003561DE03
MSTDRPDPAYAMRDNGLSLEARGLFAWLCEVAPGHITVETIASGTGIGLTKAARVRRELVAGGYLSQHRGHDARGQLTWSYEIHSRPMREDEAKAS